MVLVQILSDDKVWAHLLAANLRARGISSRIGDVSWFESGDERLAIGNPLILDLSTHISAGRSEYKLLVESNKAEWDKVIAVVDSAWLRYMQRHLSSISVVRRHPDMRKLIPDILEIIFDRQAAQF